MERLREKPGLTRSVGEPRDESQSDIEPSDIVVVVVEATIDCPTRVRRTVTGLSAMICERACKQFCCVGWTVTRKSGASTMSDVA